jgi:YVTN family beta-propeller protein
MDQTPSGRRRIHGSRAKRNGLRLLWALPLVALAAESAGEDLAYVANLRASTVSVIDVPARRVVARVPVGAEPDGVAVSPDGSRIYVANFAGNSVSVIDAATRSVIATIPVDTGPVGVAVTPDGAQVYVANKLAASASVIHTATMSVIATTLLIAGDRPDAVAITPDGRFAYVTNSRKRSVSIIDTMTHEVAKVLPVDPGPVRVVMDPVRPAAYVASFNAGTVSIIDTASQEVQAVLPVSMAPTGLAIAPDGSTLYTVGTGGLVPIDLATTTVLPAIDGIPPSSSRAVAVTTDATSVYVTSLDDGTTTIVDITQNRVAGVLCLDGGPFAIAIAGTPQTALAFITEPLSGTKIRPGDRVPVRIRVRAGTVPLQSWTLNLVDSQNHRQVLAQGTSEVADTQVAEIDGASLAVKGADELSLEVQDTSGAVVRARVGVVAVDPPFALMPLDPVARPRRDGSDLQFDGSGTRLAYQDLATGGISILDVEHGAATGVPVDFAPLSWRLSADAAKFIYSRFDGALIFLDLTTSDQKVGPSYPLGDIDRAGRRVVFNRVVASGEPDIPRAQVFYYDQALLETRQLTTFPELGRLARRISGPVVSGDGTTVAFAAGYPWQIYTYDVGTRDLHSVTSLPAGVAFNEPSISDDGRWLAFTSSAEVPSRSIGALLDLQDGTLEAPIAALDGFETFDAIVTADGRGLVISTAADLDPAIGNADGNPELFLYDRDSQRFTQITDTIGAAAAYTPSISGDGGAAAFNMARTSAATCPAAGVQRDGATGFHFGRTFSVHRRPGNLAPEIEPVDDARVSVGTSFVVPFHAADPDGDRIRFFLQPVDGIDLPEGSIFVDAGDGSAQLYWFANAAQVGDYHFRLGAFDTAGEFALREFTVRVCELFADDGSCAPTPTPTASDTPSASATPTPTATDTPNPSATPTRTLLPTPTATPTRSPTATPSAAPTPTVLPTASATPSATLPASPTATATRLAASSDGGCQVVPTDGGAWDGTGGALAFVAFALLRRRQRLG